MHDERLKEVYEIYSKETSISDACNKTFLSDFDYPDVLLEYQDFQEKSAFFSQIFVETEDKFFKVLNDFNGKTNFIFRGVSEAKYALYNSLQRSIIPNKTAYPIPYKKILIDLIKHLKEIQNGIIPKYFLQQRIDYITDLALFCFLQHHGCSTPLLDWTYKLEKALFFGSKKREWHPSQKEIENYFSIYVIHLEIAEQLNPIKDIESVFSNLAETRVVNHDFIKNEVAELLPGQDISEIVLCVDKILKDRSRSRYFKKKIHTLLDTDLLSCCNLAFISDKHNQPELFVHLNNNLNIVSQDGAFFFNSHPYAPLEWVIEKNLVDDNSEYNNCYSINIHKGLLPVVHKILKQQNYTDKEIFPSPYDIANTVQQLSLKAR